MPPSHPTLYARYALAGRLSAASASPTLVGTPARFAVSRRLRFPWAPCQLVISDVARAIILPPWQLFSHAAERGPNRESPTARPEGRSVPTSKAKTEVMTSGGETDVLTSGGED